MFNAVLSDPKILKDSIDTISQIIDEGIFKIRMDGIEMIAADRAMVAVVDFKLSSEAFEKYTCDKEQAVGVNILSFLTILKRVGNDDKLSISIDNSKMRLTASGASIRNFEIPLLDISSDNIPPVAQLDFSANALINSDVLVQAIEDADIMADSIMIELSDEKINTFAEGDSSKTELCLPKGNPSIFELNAKTQARSRYPLDYLKKIMRASKLAERTKIQMSTDYPLKLEFIGDKVKMSFVLAPRVSEE